MWCRLLARLASVTVVTRADNQAAIDQHLPATPEHNHLDFVYHQLPMAEGRWAPDAQAKRLYYLLWQRGALRLARRLQHDVGYDLVWHLTWSNAWVGSVLAFLDPPFVWGPLGGGIAPPLSLVPTLGVKGTVYEGARAVIRAAGRYVNPLARSSWRQAELILVSNDDTERWLPKRHRAKVAVMPQYGITDESEPGEWSPARAGPEGRRTALFAGRLLAFKGGSLALRAIASSPGWDLVICGKGPDQRRLERLARRFGVRDRVRFMGWLPRGQVASMMKQSDVLLFPSLHDESPATVLEARLCGLPVICLDRGGAAVLAGRRAVVVSAAGGPAALTRRLTTALGEVAARDSWPPANIAALSMDARVDDLRPHLERLLGARADGPMAIADD
jgi:glycosyltransferase involved in cell wall biosynthesis